jgi:hypothetical protein
MSVFNIKSDELADALDITIDQLYNYCDFFDSDPNDSWELVEDFHFKWGPLRSRIFSPEGAVEICNYLEENKEERPILKRWKRWVLQRDRKLKGLMIAKRIQEISALGDGQIIFQNSTAFLSPRACREVLGLGKRQDILRRTFVEVQRNENTEVEALKSGTDFITLDDKDNHYLSRSGLASVSKQLSIKLTQKHRQEWVKVVAEYAPKALSAIEKHEEDRQKRIKQAMDSVRKKARGRCQITNRRQAAHGFDLEAHHLFDKKHHPQLADVELNLIAIASDIHLHFHQWMGGPHVPCTIEDMEKYIAEFSSHLFSGDDIEQATKVAIRLSQTKTVLRVHK